jgi:hypothetical protein
VNSMGGLLPQTLLTIFNLREEEEIEEEEKK